MDASNPLGLVHLFAQSDAVGRSVLVLLFAMSVASWTLIVVKAVRARRAARDRERFLRHFWDAPSIAAAERRLADEHPTEPFSHLAWHALRASRHHAEYGGHRLAEGGSAAEFVTRAIRRVVEEESARLEEGLTALASIGSTAPFVGLFGTVWGVYHALAAIGTSGQGTLDRVAGPVGEALIMTGAGLAVAIPAVLAYNTFTRGNRNVLARLDGFAHDVFALVTTGATYAASATVRPIVRDVAPATR